ncbi:MAG: cytochrome c oxidase subunit II [Gemmatimonadota bacterium]|nr:cytochrome c oxidase subunit II [Gemmatimonadota bacterium]
MAWAAGALLATTLVVSACGGDYPQSTLDPSADFGERIDALYRTIFWWALGVFVVVEAALLFVILRYRERPGLAEPKHVHGSTLLEVAWTLAPAIVLVFIAVPTIRTIFETDGTPDAGALEIEVIGHQWWWEFRYPEFGITTANEMHVPRGRPVALSMTSADVIHSFWVPRLGGKRDVIPRRTTRLAFTPDSVGEFLGQCAEFCGTSHANMRFRFMVDGEDEFVAWVAQQQAPPVAAEALTGLAREGAELFANPAKLCFGCHMVDGVSPGVLGPNLTHVGSRSMIASGILPNTREGLARWIRDPVGEKPGSLMPKVPLTEQEIAALVAYLQSLE